MLSPLLSFADRILALLVHAAWQASLLGLLVLGITWLLGSRIGPRWRFIIWLIVFSRLALPVLPSAPWSVYGFVDRPIAEGRVVFEPVKSADVSAKVGQPPQWTQTPLQGREDLSEGRHIHLLPEVGQGQLPAARQISLSAWAGAIWAVGAFGFLLRLIFSHIKLRRRQSIWQSIDNSECGTILQQCHQDLSIRRKVELYASPDQMGPATCGLIQPRIVLPRDLLAALTTQELRLLLLHELVHVRRQDVLIDLGATIIASMYWFHPVGWLTRYFLRRERELACDVAVLDFAEGNGSAAYGQVLLKAVESLITPVPTAGIVGVFGPGRFSLLKQRIRLIAAYRRSTRLGLVGGAALAACLALIGLTDAQTQSPAKETQQSATAPPASGEKAVEEKKENTDEAEPGVRHHPFTVKGRTLDREGRPIDGATVFLVATNSGPDRTLGQATADQSGHYEFNNIPLPYYPAKKKDQWEEGAFQVFGKAPGHGFAWLGMRFLFIDPDFLDENGKLNVIEPTYGYLPKDSIEQELTFAPVMPISGRFVDQHGQPIAGVKVALTNCDYLDKEGKETNTAYREFRYAVRQAAILMPEQVETVSDGSGRFRLESVPAGIVCRLHMSHPEYGQWALHTATAENAPAEIGGNPIVRSPIEMTRQKTRKVEVRVRYADTGEPVAGAPVGAYLRIGTNNSYGKGDKNGRVTLNLPPAEYTFWSHPPKGHDYLSVHSKFVVEDQAVPQATELMLPPAAVLILKALDAETGEGIEGVTFFYEEFMENPGKHWSVQSNDTTNDFPATNAEGILRALVAPGERRYGVPFNPLPNRYVADIVDMRGRIFKLTAGETVTAEFRLRQTRNARELRNNRES